MLFSLNWINQYVDLKDKTPQEIYSALNSLGLEVETFKPLCSGIGLIAGQINVKEKHPNADKLTLCQVDTGNEVLQVVCGADNFSAGDKVIFALPGAELPGGVKIKKSEFRGQESNGMICSLNELGYPEDMLVEEEKNGIYVIDKEVKLGDKAILKTLGLEDIIFEIAITPNRGDCLSIYQIAKELSVYFNREIKKLNIEKIEFRENKDIVKNKDTSVFSLIKISNLKNGNSTSNIARLIQLAGINSKDLLVDINNFVMLETGQPLHFYDTDKIDGAIYVTSGEKGLMLGLDDEEYKYQKSDIIIKDSKKIIGIAGIIGSKDSAVDEKTKSIIVEAAIFNRTKIRHTSSRLNKFTQSANRFTKGRDANQIPLAHSRVIKLLKQHCGDIKISDMVLYGNVNKERIEVEFNFNKVEKYLGFSISKEKVDLILNKLNFLVRRDKVYPPTTRIDIEKDVDIIEELARINGYDKIPNKFVPVKPSLRKNCPIFDYKNKVQNLLTSFGGHEVITYSLTKEKLHKDFSLNAIESIKLARPLSSEREYMRHSAIPSLLEVAKYNDDHGMKNINIFEISDVYGQTPIKELTILHKGDIAKDLLFNDSKPASFFTIKGYVIALLEDLGFVIPRIIIRPIQENKFFNHFAAAEIYLGNKLICRFGEVNSIYLKELKMKDTFIAQINISELINQIVSKTKIKEMSNLPSVEQDYTFDIDQDVSITKIMKVIKTSSKIIINSEIISIYKGDSVPKNKKAITAKVTYNNPKTTIKESDIKEFRDSLISSAQKIGATFRG